MSNLQTREVIASHGSDVALEFHLTSRMFPPVHRDFWPAIKHAVQLANEGNWLATVALPNGRVVSVAATVEQLRLDPFIEDEDVWAPLED